MACGEGDQVYENVMPTILCRHSRNGYAPEDWTDFTAACGFSLIATEGAVWIRQRGLAQGVPHDLLTVGRGDSAVAG